MHTFPVPPTSTITLPADEEPFSKLTFDTVGGDVHDPLSAQMVRYPDDDGPAAVTDRLIAVAVRGMSLIPATVTEMLAVAPGAGMDAFTEGRFSLLQ